MSVDRSELDVRIVEYLYGDYDEANRTALRAEIDADEVLRAQLNEWLEIDALLDHLPDEDPDPQVARIVMDVAREEARVPTFNFWVWLQQFSAAPAFAAIFLLVVGGGLLLELNGQFEDVPLESSVSETPADQPVIGIEPAPPSQRDALGKSPPTPIQATESGQTSDSPELTPEAHTKRKAAALRQLQEEARDRSMLNALGSVDAEGSLVDSELFGDEGGLKAGSVKTPFKETGQLDTIRPQPGAKGARGGQVIGGTLGGKRRASRKGMRVASRRAKSAAPSKTRALRSKKARRRAEKSKNARRRAGKPVKALRKGPTVQVAPEPTAIPTQSTEQIDQAASEETVVFDDAVHAKPVGDRPSGTDTARVPSASGRKRSMGRPRVQASPKPAPRSAPQRARTRVNFEGMDVPDSRPSEPPPVAASPPSADSESGGGVARALDLNSGLGDGGSGAGLSAGRSAAKSSQSASPQRIRARADRDKASGRCKQAVRGYERYLRLTVRAADRQSALMALGACHEVLGAPDRAIAAYRKVVRLGGDAARKAAQAIQRLDGSSAP